MDRWYYTKDGKVFGPFTKDSLGQMCNAGIISMDTMVALEGSRDWIDFKSIQLSAQPMDALRKNDSIISEFAGKVSQVSGLEKLEGFSLGVLFSQVFKSHSPEEIEEHFIVGTIDTTPKIQDISASWPAPWAFVRLLVFSVVISLGFYYAIDRFNSPILIPGWIFVGCFGIPFAVLIFFLEANILRNVSFYRMISLMIFGGLLSLMASLFLFIEHQNKIIVALVLLVGKKFGTRNK